MKVMGLFAVTLAICLVSMSLAQPLLIPAGTATATFTAAGGLVLADTAGLVLATIPAGWVYAGLAAKKLAALKLILDAQEANQ